MKILAIGSHPDDIEFGCGGTLLKFSKSSENEIYLLIMTKGEKGGRKDVREKEQEESGKILKVKKIFWGGYEDTKVPFDVTSIQRIESVLKEVNPGLIFVFWSEDAHQDHRNTSLSTITAARYIRNILFYEVPTTQNFSPNVFVDIEDVIEEKIGLLKAHDSQVYATRIAGLSILESARATAYFRGYQGRVKFAEGFVSHRLSLFYYKE